MERIAAALQLARDGALSDDEVVRRVRSGETALYEVLMRRHNGMLYRAVRSILRDEAEVEDAVQQAWVKAYANLEQFRGASRVSTWLVAVALNEARARVRRPALVALDGDGADDAAEDHPSLGGAPPPPGPEEEASARELVDLAERAVDRLPRDLRTVFMLRAVDGLDTSEAATALGVSEDVVKTRLHRARAQLRASLATDVERAARSAFPFLGPRCDRIVEAVLARIAAGDVP